MNKKDTENLTLETYENEFSFKENRSNLNISFNRIAFIFFIFLMICLIYSIKVSYLGLLNSKISPKITNFNKVNHRADILDNNGNFIAKTVNTLTLGINPNLIIDEKKLLINLQLIFPEKDFSNIKKKIKKKKYFRVQKELQQDQIEKLKHLGDKSIKFEEQITRIYPQKNLFSHIIGQIDDENNGISGIEKFFDYELKKKEESLKLTVDTDIQFLIREELIKFQDIFKNIGSAAILMNVNNGNIISMVSLPDFDLHKREVIKDVNYINRATKGVYELGSVFKTFTIASGLNEEVIEPETEFKDLPKNITCAGRPIREYDEKIPSNLTAEQILIRSGNIGSVRIAQRIGIEKFKSFLVNIGVIDKIEFDIEEVGQPISFRWGKCKLATSSFGHGITTTPLQLAKGYSIITNGGYDIRPTLIKNLSLEKKIRKKILKDGVSEKMNLILRKIVSTKEGTANFANIKGYEIGGKTGTAQKSINGIYSKNKVNTFVSIFPTSKPKYVFLVLLDEPKTNKNYVYHYKDGSGWKQTGTPYNTAGWTSVEVAGKIIERIGPILATKYGELN
tara:strand:- start:18125 stop:19816 length:1692 start_codon:yes stop_codon:yes gene_type:complete